MSVVKKPVTVPVLDLRAQYQTIRDEIEPVVHALFESQMFVLGPEVAELEVELARLCGVARGIGCAFGNRCPAAPLDGDRYRPGG